MLSIRYVNCIKISYKNINIVQLMWSWKIVLVTSVSRGNERHASLSRHSVSHNWDIGSPVLESSPTAAPSWARATRATGPAHSTQPARCTHTMFCLQRGCIIQGFTPLLLHWHLFRVPSFRTITAAIFQLRTFTDSHRTHSATQVAACRSVPIELLQMSIRQY